jgi:hypothetical protein
MGPLDAPPSRGEQSSTATGTSGRPRDVIVADLADGPNMLTIEPETAAFARRRRVETPVVVIEPASATPSRG